jgi:hypothetical protein
LALGVGSRNCFGSRCIGGGRFVALRLQCARLCKYNSCLITSVAAYLQLRRMYECTLVGVADDGVGMAEVAGLHDDCRAPFSRAV